MPGDSGTYRNSNSQSNNDFSALYVLYSGKQAMHVGISKTVIRRLKQHLVSEGNNTASLVYLLARDKYRAETGAEFVGLKRDFPFHKYRPTIQDQIHRDWSFVVVPCSANGFELSFTEIYVANALQSHWNSFDTH